MLVASLRHQKAPVIGILFEVLNRDLGLLFLCNVLGAFGDGLFSVQLPIYLSDNLKATATEIGILYAVMSLLAALTLLVAGLLADKYDRKKIMIAGWIAWIPAPLIFSIAGDWLQALPGMVLWGFWLGGPTTTAYIVATANKAKMTLTFTTISAAWSLGYIFSPALGGYMSAAVGMQYVFYSATIFYALACITLSFIRSQRATNATCQTPQEKQSSFQLLKNRKLMTLSVFFASLMFTLMLFRPFMTKFVRDVYLYDNFHIGVLGSVLFFGSAILGIWLGRFGDRRRKSGALAISLLMCSASTLIIVLSGNFPLLLVAFFVAGGSYLTWSLMGAIVAPLAPESIRARWISIPQTLSMFTSFVAPYIGGVLYDASPYYPMYFAIALTFVIALLSLLKVLDS
jgi:MFS family permease